MPSSYHMVKWKNGAFFRFHCMAVLRDKQALQEPRILGSLMVLSACSTTLHFITFSTRLWEENFKAQGNIGMILILGEPRAFKGSNALDLRVVGEEVLTATDLESHGKRNANLCLCRKAPLLLLNEEWASPFLCLKREQSC